MPDEITKAERNALALINSESEPNKLRDWIRNARRQSSAAVERAAFARLCVIQPEANPGTVEHDVWQSIFALEEMFRQERGVTTRLTRTRQKIARDGEAKTASDLTLKRDPAPGFKELISRNHPELTFEAVVLRHPKTFDQEVLVAARARLQEAEVDIELLLNNKTGI